MNRLITKADRLLGPSILRVVAITIMNSWYVFEVCCAVEDFLT